MWVIFKWIINNLEIILNCLTLIVTCIISYKTLKQTQYLHTQSVNVSLYEKRKDLLNKIDDDKTDISIELELLFERTFLKDYEELKSSKERIKFLNDQMVRLEKYYQENENLAVEYKELCMRAEATDLAELYHFYDSHPIRDYCPETEDYFETNGKEISKELNMLNKAVEEKVKFLKIQMKDFINKSLQNNKRRK